MAIGAQDYIDKLLVKKYSKQQVDNHEPIESMIDPNKMLETMNDFAAVQRGMLSLANRLSTACYGINAMSARYGNKRSAIG